MANNAVRSSVSLAQRFSFKPVDGTSASRSPRSLAKRRRLDDTVTGLAANADGSIDAAVVSNTECTSVGKADIDEAQLDAEVDWDAAVAVLTSSEAEHANAKQAKKRRLSASSNIATPPIPTVLPVPALSRSVATSSATSPESIASSSIADDKSVAESFIQSIPSEKAVDGKPTRRELLQLECDTIHPSWLKYLQEELRRDYFINLKRFLWSEGVTTAATSSKTVFPPARDIYSWSHLTPLSDVRVVILGQDPYHNDGQAHGLAFSVRSNVKIPPSLKNIYKEIKNDYPSFVVPNHGYLGSWARQGVLMLNTCLTVRAHQANSHSKRGWESFTDAVLKAIDARPGPGVVFLAWGTPALNRIKSLIPAARINNKHCVLSSVHPSPLSASRGFFGNHHFKRANEWLCEQYGEAGGIDWTRLEPERV